MTKERIRQWYEHWDGQVYVSFSGGKDSTVLKHIVDSMYDDVPSLFVNTGLEYPEIQKFAMSQKNVVTVRPKMRFDEVLKKYGYPLISKEQSAFIKEYKTTNSQKLKNIRLNGNKWGMGKISNKWLPIIDAPFEVSDKCCDVMKKNPVKEYEKKTGRKPFIGTMACESHQRKSNWLIHGCNAFNKKRPTSQPLSFWTEQDILHYIKKYKVSYCSVYGDVVVDEKPYEDAIKGQMNIYEALDDYEGSTLKTTGCNRTGCTFCMFGCHLEKEPNRFQKLKETHPRQYDYCINGGEMVDGKWQPNKEGLGLGKVLDYIGVKYD
jgi:3'-phosphoadenosine 5'-phosphosulfate sulfotransferase (PAPS reductase)/FAD synthetase